MVHMRNVEPCLSKTGSNKYLGKLFVMKRAQNVCIERGYKKDKLKTFQFTNKKRRIALQYREFDDILLNTLEFFNPPGNRQFPAHFSC